MSIPVEWEPLGCIKIYVSNYVPDNGKFFEVPFDVNSRICGPNTFEELKKHVDTLRGDSAKEAGKGL